MPKKNEPLVKVYDPKGEVFEVTGRNAVDLVQHLGWSYVEKDMTDIDPEVAKLAHAPRKKQSAKDIMKSHVAKSPKPKKRQLKALEEEKAEAEDFYDGEDADAA